MSAMALRLVYYAASRGIATLSNLDMQQCPKTFCNNVQKYFAILSKKCLQKTLGENETLTKDVLTEFLGSETGNIKDLSEEAQKEMEQIKAENEQGEERAEFSVFGNAPICKLSDEQKTASFSYGTGAYYQDELLYEKCASIYKSADETVLEEADSKNVYMKAKKILLTKLSLIGMTEIDIYKITQYQKENVTFYEIEFTPSYEGMGIVHEFGSIASGEAPVSGILLLCGYRGSLL